MKRYSLPSALSIILFSTCLISGTGFFIAQMIKERRENRLHDAQFAIKYVIQTGPEKKALKSDYLAELMGLSDDFPTNVYQFDPELARKRLVQSVLIREASVKPCPPNAVYVDYTIRTPLAKVQDFHNIAIDEEGHLFPISPFLSPKTLPEITFGLKEFTRWELSREETELPFHLLALLRAHAPSHSFQIKALDIAAKDAPTLGKRQLILHIDNHILRLTPKNYPKELAHYLELRAELNLQEQVEGKKTKVIDLRLPNLAYLEEVDE